MVWWISLLLFLAGLLLFIFLDLPVYLSLFIVNFIASICLFGIKNGLPMIVRSLYSGLASFTLLPIAFFVVMGEILFLSGIAMQTLNSVGKFVGAIPGRIAVLALITGTIFGALSGSALASTALLGSLMIPEMLKQGYSKSLSASSVLAGGALSMIIPPSGVAIIIGTLGRISIAKLLVGGLLPGLLLSFFNISFIIIKSILDPKAAPKYQVEVISSKEKFNIFLRDILPLFFLMFLTVGSIIFGVATPSEAGALGAVGAFILAIAYKKMTTKILLNVIKNSVKTSAMILIIIAVAGGYSQFLTFTGATTELTQAITRLNTSPIIIIIMMLLLVFIMGCFVSETANLFIVIPIFLPVVVALGYDPVWFGLLLLVMTSQANITPPYGLALFVLKGVVPEYNIKDIIKGGLPVIIMQTFVVMILLFFPGVALWLPSVIR